MLQHKARVSQKRDDRLVSELVTVFGMNGFERSETQVKASGRDPYALVVRTLQVHFDARRPTVPESPMLKVRGNEDLRQGHNGGAYETTKWPVLNLGGHPSVTTAHWRLRGFFGAVRSPLVLTWSDYTHGFEQVEDTSDFHCVTKWSHWIQGGAR